MTVKSWQVHANISFYIDAEIIWNAQYVSIGVFISNAYYYHRTVSYDVFAAITKQGDQDKLVMER